MKKQWKQEFIIGNMHQYGIYRLMQGASVQQAEKDMLKMLDDHIKSLRKSFNISSKDEQKFVEIKSTLRGMIRGYAEHYKRDLKVEKHVGNEVDNTYDLCPTAQIRIKLDNILKIKNKLYLHEGKAYKYINDDMVQNIKSNLQTATYFHVHNANARSTEKFSGIIFDVIQKPSIKKKLTESYRGYLRRLEDYYKGADSVNKFFKEVFREPSISYDKWEHNIIGWVGRMRELIKGRDPILSFNECHWCDFREICYEGETKRNMVMYKKKGY
jgi:hypothetical protein